jgi:predicted RNase H-like HicB family nuclease
MSFEVCLTPDASGWIVAEVPELPGCFSQGRTEAEALANIREGIDA